MAAPESLFRTASWKRLDGVDLLRGLAIFFVLMNHVNIRLLFAKVPYLKGLPQQVVHSLVWNGQFGVQIFFAVSGFLITTTTLRRWGSLSKIRVDDFYRLRFARIAPLLILLLAVLSTLHFAQFRDFVVPAKTGGLGRALFAALTFHVNVLEARRGYLPGNWDILWSLSVEEMFYLFFPLVCRTVGRGRMLIVLLAGFVILGPFGRTAFARGNEVWVEYSYLGSMDAIAMGCLTAILAGRMRTCKPVRLALAGSGAAILIFILGFSLQANRAGLGRSGLDMTILALGTCMIIAASSETDWRSPLILRPLLRIGRNSYEIYLTHMFAVFALFHLFVAAGKPLKGVPVLFAAAILVSGVLGSLVARLYSDPINRLLRRRFARRSAGLRPAGDRQIILT